MRGLTSGGMGGGGGDRRSGKLYFLPKNADSTPPLRRRNRVQGGRSTSVVAELHRACSGSESKDDTAKNMR